MRWLGRNKKSSELKSDPIPVPSSLVRDSQGSKKFVSYNTTTTTPVADEKMMLEAITSLAESVELTAKTVTQLTETVAQLVEEIGLIKHRLEDLEG